MKTMFIKKLKLTKRGFTIIELLAVIIILGIIAVIVIPTVNNILISSSQKLYDITTGRIENAAKDYMLEYKNDIVGLEINGVGFVYLNEMIEKGVIGGPVINPLTDEPFVATAGVLVTELANNYTFEFKLQYP